MKNNDAKRTTICFFMIHTCPVTLAVQSPYRASGALFPSFATHFRCRRSHAVNKKGDPPRGMLFMAAPRPVCRSAAAILGMGPASAGLKGHRLLLVRHGATCTRFTPPSAASSSPAPRRVFGTARKGEARAGQQTGDTKARQDFFKLLCVHLRTPFELIVFFPKLATHASAHFLPRHSRYQPKMASIGTKSKWGKSRIYQSAGLYILTIWTLKHSILRACHG